MEITFNSTVVHFNSERSSRTLCRTVPGTVPTNNISSTQQYCMNRVILQWYRRRMASRSCALAQHSQYVGLTRV